MCLSEGQCLIINHVSVRGSVYYVDNYIYYQPEVRREYCGLGVFLLQYFSLIKIWKIFHYNCMNMNIVG